METKTACVNSSDKLMRPHRRIDERIYCIVVGETHTNKPMMLRTELGTSKKIKMNVIW